MTETKSGNTRVVVAGVVVALAVCAILGLDGPSNEQVPVLRQLFLAASLSAVAATIFFWPQISDWWFRAKLRTPESKQNKPWITIRVSTK